MVKKKSKILQFFNLFNRAFGKYKKHIVILTLLGFASGFLEAIGVNALIPLFSFIIGDGSTGSDVISQFLERLFLYFDIQFTVVSLLVFILTLFFFKSILKLLFGYIRIKITADYEEETRNELFGSIIESDWYHLIKQKMGHLETILMIDVPASSSLLKYTSTAIMFLTSVVMYLVVAINISYFITLLTVLVGGIIFFVMRPMIYRLRMIGYATAKINKEITHNVSESIFGIKTVKTMHVLKAVKEKVSHQFLRLKNLQVRSAFLKFTPNPIFEFVAILYICSIFAFAYTSPSFDLIALPSMIYLIHRIFTYTQKLQSQLHTAHSLAPHLISVLNYKEQASHYKERTVGKDVFLFTDALSFQNVSFSYGDNKMVIKDVSFRIRKGSLIGVIGPSGVGKTTLVDLVLRLHKPTVGKIVLDTKDISNIDMKSWRKNIGYVSQDIYLTNDTIGNNITFYDDSITDEEIKEAAKMANIYDFIQEQKNAFDTKIGDRGIMLSAGQRQRIVIARVLARKPEILILDEATSALDNESELQIQRVIKNLKGTLTVIVIAHRLSTVMDSDELFIIDKGRIVEHGSPQVLIKNKQSYFYKVHNIRNENHVT